MTSKIRISVVALGTVVAGYALGASGCSSNEVQSPATGGTGATATNTGGSGADLPGPTGGSGPAGSTGGGSSTPDGGAATVDPCPGSACALTSITSTTTTCTDNCDCNSCGIHRLGKRSCPCQAGATGTMVYTCELCNFDSAVAAGTSVVQKPTAELPACAVTTDSLQEDQADCGTSTPLGTVCQSGQAADRYCACWFSNGANRWDCATKPSFWALTG